MFDIIEINECELPFATVSGFWLISWFLICVSKEYRRLSCPGFSYLVKLLCRLRWNIGYYGSYGYWQRFLVVKLFNHKSILALPSYLNPHFSSNLRNRQPLLCLPTFIHHHGSRIATTTGGLLQRLTAQSFWECVWCLLYHSRHLPCWEINLWKCPKLALLERQTCTHLSKRMGLLGNLLAFWRQEVLQYVA